MDIASWFGWGRSARVYLDYASAPPVCPEAVRAMRAAEEYMGNPGAIHAEGVDAKRALESARTRIASYLAVKAREVVFTSGLTESNTLAIMGVARARSLPGSGGKEAMTLSGTHWLVSSIEHASVLDCFAEIERLGGSVSFLDPDSRGIIRAETVEHTLRKETVLVSVGWTNNEIGVIQPLKDISRTLKAHALAHGTEPLLHADAGQGPLYLPTTMLGLGADLVSIGSNKLYGPHGIGLLVVAPRVLASAHLAPVLFGGPQERKLRPGTENVALAAGFAAAYEVAVHERAEESRRLATLRDDFARKIAAAVSGAVINGDTAHALPHMLNISIPGINSEYVALSLDRRGIAVSTKSACREGEEFESHVVEALARAEGPGSSSWRAKNTLRFSLGRDTTAGNLTHTLEALTEVVRLS